MAKNLNVPYKTGELPLSGRENKETIKELMDNARLSITPKDDKQWQKNLWAWDSHIYLAGEIAKSVKYLHDVDRGYPYGLTPKRWKGYLKTMYDGFKDYYDSDGDFYEYKLGHGNDCKHYKDSEIEQQLNCKQCKKKNPIRLNKRRQNRFLKAQGLLKTYFDQLWD